MRKKMREIRAKHKMTLRELGIHLGKSKQYMSEVERGKIRLTYDMALGISQVFAATPDDLFLPDESNNNGQKNDCQLDLPERNSLLKTIKQET